MTVYKYPKLAWVYAMRYELTLQEAHDRLINYKSGHNSLASFISLAFKNRNNWKFE